MSLHVSSELQEREGIKSIYTLHFQASSIHDKQNLRELGNGIPSFL